MIMNKRVISGLLIAFTLSLVGSTSTSAQGTSQKKETPRGWHTLDKEKDGYYGVSLDKAYEFVKGKKGNTVIVAVIDSGIDTLHEDLREILWRNPKEIPGNGIDDDGNGYVDDIFGWNFLGGKDGRNVTKDSYEGARVYHKLKAKYAGKEIDPSTLSPEAKAEYEVWLKARKKIEGEEVGGGIDLMIFKRALQSAIKNDSVVRKAIGKEIYTGKELQEFTASTPEARSAKNAFLYLFKAYDIMDQTNQEFISDFSEFISSEERKAEAKERVPTPYRQEIVQDNEEDINDKNYGNSNVMVDIESPVHGTHVAGIIAAKRNNGKGMDGIADNVQIMMLRAVPDGDEHDKDIALAIRYAVDNGAKIINMSFGKDFSPNKKWVDEAVKYAESKGVLLVHAAGNDHKNIDTTDNYPNSNLEYLKVRANNYISVGASSDPTAESGFKSFTASFSNYGKNQVDVFAPGTKIYSTTPGSNYRNLQGTSMASPVVAGVAALVLSYYPNLTPAQLKWVIEKSATPLTAKVKLPGSEDEMVMLSEISRTGGVVNAYAALKLAETLKPSKKENLPKSSLKNKKNG